MSLFSICSQKRPNASSRLGGSNLVNQFLWKMVDCLFTVQIQRKINSEHWPELRSASVGVNIHSPKLASPFPTDLRSTMVSHDEYLLLVHRCGSTEGNGSRNRNIANEWGITNKILIMHSFSTCEAQAEGTRTGLVKEGTELRGE